MSNKKKTTAKANKLSKEENYEHKVVDVTDDIIFIMDKDGNLKYVNKAAAKSMGKKPAEMVGKNIRTIFLKAESDSMIKNIRQVLKEDQPKYEERQLVFKKGKAWMSTLLNPILDTDGKTRLVQGISCDITEKKEFEIQAMEYKRELEQIIEQMPYPVEVTDPKGTATIVNQAFLDMFGIPSSDLVIGKYNVFKDPIVESLGIMKQVKKAYNGEFVYIPEIRMELEEVEKGYLGTKRGETIHDVSMFPVKHANGKLWQVVTIWKDVTDQKQAENAAKEGEKSLLDILESMADPIHVIDRDFRIVLFNKAFKVWVKELGMDVKTEGKKLFDIFTFLSSDVRKEYDQVFKDGKIVTTEETTHINDELIFTKTHKIPVFENGEVTRIITEIEDTTDAKEKEERLRQSFEKVKIMMDRTIHTMSTIVEMRDPYTAGHQQRVAELAGAIAKEMGLSDEEIERVEIAGKIHDVGKMLVPAEILSRPGKLNEYEVSMIRNHAQAGREILEGTEFEPLISDVVYQHHERLNGSGYPNGLKGKKIAEGARILAVADVVEAMTSHRPYRPSLGLKEALKEIRKNKGELYDRDVANACLRLFNKKGFSLYKPAKKTT